MRFPARMLGALAALACMLGVAAPPADATVFYGVDAQNRLVRFDPFSSAFRDVVPLTGPGASSVLALDVRPATGGLFAVTRSTSGIQLARIHQGTGALRPVGLPVSISGAIAGASIDVHEVRDDAQVLIDTGGTDRSLHLDLDTGAVSDPGNLPGGTDYVGLAWSPATNGSTPVALAVNALNNRLSFGDPSGLTSDIGPLDDVALGQTTSLDFAPDLVLWLYGGAAAPQHVFAVDWLTGHATSIVQVVAPLKAFAVQLTGGIAFGSGTVGAGEGDGTAAVTLHRAAPAEGIAKVRWSTADGTAAAGADYTAASGEVTFARGQTSKAVSVPLLQDSAAEGTERVTLHLDAVDGVPAGPDAQLVIADDDQPAAPGPPPDTAAPVLLALPVKLAAKRSLKLPFALSEASRVTVTLGLTKQRAKKLKLSAELATAELDGVPGDNTAALKLSKKEARKLHARSSTKATADIVATDAAGNRATRTMKVTLT
jgi:Calx-beta domain